MHLRYKRFTGAAAGTVFVLALSFGVPAAGAAVAHVDHGFKVAIYPAYTTAGQSTTFQVTLTNTSSMPTTLASVQVTPPPGFTLTASKVPQGQGHKAIRKQRMFTLEGLKLKRGNHRVIDLTTTAPAKCGQSMVRWGSRAFQRGNATGSQLTLQTSMSTVGVTVVCPQAAACGDGGPPCSTSLSTSASTYGVINNASSGTLRQTLDVGAPLVCSGYARRDPNWYDSVVTPASTSPPLGTVAPTVVNDVTYTIKNTTPNGIEFCLGAAFDFATASGTMAPAGKLPNGNPGFIGLIPSCLGGAPPCISDVSQSSDMSSKTGYDVILTIDIPEKGDPWGGA